MRARPFPRFCYCVSSILVCIGGHPELRANTVTGAACTGTPSACYSDEIKATIEECIQANMADPPDGNPGPFTQGYDSIVVLSGQCFSGGLSELTGIGDDVVVGAAAASDKESHWKQNGNDTSDARYLWIDKLVKEINANPNRPIKDILDAVKTANPDPEAMTPSPSTSTGGASVTLGDPNNNSGKSYHAVLFGGVEDTGANADSANAATQKALNDMENALKTKGNVPAANIAKMFPGTCEDLKNMIKAAWEKMNDNEQFILVLADHGASCAVDKEPVEPDPETDGQKSSFVTPPEHGSENVHSPNITLDTLAVSQAAPVLLNGQQIGNLTFSTGPARYHFPFPPPLLAPVGGQNLLQILAPPPNAQVVRVMLSTGPVAAGSIGPAIPAASTLTLIVLATGIIIAGAYRLRRKAPAA